MRQLPFFLSLCITGYISFLPLFRSSLTGSNNPSSSAKSKRRLSTGSALASLARSNAKQSRKSRRRLSGRSDGYAAMTYISCSFPPLFICSFDG